MAWEFLTLPKKFGGLGLTNLIHWNKAAVLKHLWRIDANKDSLWIKWVHMYFLKNNNCFNMRIPETCTWYSKKLFALRDQISGPRVWKDLMNARNDFSIHKCYLLLVG